jgi:hypothetical protein
VPESPLAHAGFAYQHLRDADDAVTITGTRQPDGSILAQTIQIAGGQPGS